MTQELYIVTQSSGSYEDYISWPVAAFADKEVAEAWVTKANEGFAADKARREALHHEFEAKYDELVEKHREGESPEWAADYEKLNQQYPDRLNPYDDLHEYRLDSNPIPLNPTL